MGESKVTNDSTNQVTLQPFNYTLFKLPKELLEISGITFIDNANVLAIDDEDGYLYQYDLLKEKIVWKKQFAGPGDYEDLVLVVKDVFVVSSKGDLYEIKNFRDPNSSITRFKTPLSEKNNVEGLAYDFSNKRLLLASKDAGLDNDKDKEVYAFSLENKTLSTIPAYSINLAEIEEYFEGDALEERSKKFLKALGNKNMNEVFRPSAITINPKTKNIYILSSINNLIAVLDDRNKLVRIISLKGKDFIQPEGLAFSPSGQLFVSNEGNGKRANIIRLEDEN